MKLRRIFIFLSLMAALGHGNAGTEVQSWWKQRMERPDIYYPHQAHFQVMQQRGDSCMLCHSFAANHQHDLPRLETLNAIANEPLEAICHSCHVDEKQAPSRCDVCHSNPQEVWPADHDFDYTNAHSIDAELNPESCTTCHIAVSFCTDCHFGREANPSVGHNLGYINIHGLDARTDTFSCGVCHTSNYCQDCHERP